MTASRGGFFFSVLSFSRKLQIISTSLTLAASVCVAQQPATITIPAGTRLALALTHPVDSHATHRGDEIFAQTTSPLIVADQVAIPAGTFVQGKIAKLAHRGSRGELLMQSISVIFPNGYVATINGPLNMESDEGTAWNNPSSGTKAAIVAAPLAGLGIGAAIGAAQHTTESSTLGGTTLTASTPKGLAIGSLVGLAAGGAVSLVLLARSHDFYVEEGAPLELSLPQSVTLARMQDSNSQSADTAPPAHIGLPPSPMPASANSGTCYIPGRPGTPPTYIPGTPGTADSPGTPGTFIPGTPPTPPIPYSCP